MLDIKYIRENAEAVKKSTSGKQMDPSIVDKFLEVDKKKLDLLQQVEKLREDRNKFAKAKNIDEGKRIKAKLKVIEPKLSKIEKEADYLLFVIPNPADPSAPKGKGEEDNVKVRKWGGGSEFQFPTKRSFGVGN